MATNSYRDLRVWQRSVEFAVSCCRVADRFPTSGRFGLTSQLKRATISISANIAEDDGRTHLGDYLRHLSIARGSLSEVEALLTVAQRLGYLSEESLAELLEVADHIGRMLTRMLRALRRSGS